MVLHTVHGLWEIHYYKGINFEPFNPVYMPHSDQNLIIYKDFGLEKKSRNDITRAWLQLREINSGNESNFEAST